MNNGARRLTAPSDSFDPRVPMFKAPAVYDGCPNFETFQRFHARDLISRRRAEQLLKAKSRFVDWVQDPKVNETDGLCMQEMMRIQKTLKNDDKQALTGNDSTEARKPSTRSSLNNISRSPIDCPIEQCGRTIGLSAVLMHFLRDHDLELAVQCKEIYIGQCLSLIFDPNLLDFKSNACLGVLAYGGLQNDNASLPGARGICLPNTILPGPYSHLNLHLPILIMACRTAVGAMLSDKGLEERIINPNDENQNMIVLWLASNQTTRPVYGSLIVYDKQRTLSYRRVLKVRFLNEPQSPSEFLFKDVNYMRLNPADVCILSGEGKEHIQLQVMINEFNE